MFSICDTISDYFLGGGGFCICKQDLNICGVGGQKEKKINKRNEGRLMFTQVIPAGFMLTHAFPSRKKWINLWVGCQSVCFLAFVRSIYCSFLLASSVCSSLRQIRIV